MGKKEEKRDEISKKTVTILVIIAIILAVSSIAYNYFDIGKKVSSNVQNEDIAGGKVGITIISPEIEDKGAGGTNG